MALQIKKVLVGGVFLLALIFVALGLYRGELRIIWNNGKILCLTCIGIK
ncbi:CD1871A family CXXC motif-containing protein [Thermovibrio sp.]